MDRVLIIGAGAQGGPCASILAGDKTVEEIRLGDIDKIIANKDKYTKLKIDDLDETISLNDENQYRKLQIFIK